MRPPAAGDPARAFLPDDLCNGIDPILLEADAVSAKEVGFRLSVPCADAGVAYQVRGLCATFVKVAIAGNPQCADAAKSLHFAVHDRCFVLRGRLPTSFFEDDFKPPAAGYTVRSFLPDEVCDGVKAISVETDMVPGKDLHFRFAVRSVDANVACEVRGLCETFCKVVGSQGVFVLPSMKEAGKSLRFAVQDRRFVMQGTLPASIFDDMKTLIHGLLPDDVRDGIESIRFKADMDAGKDAHFCLSIPCADAGIAYQIRGLIAVITKATTNAALSEAGVHPDMARAVRSFQLAVHDRSFVWQGTLPASFFQDSLKEATSQSRAPQGPQTAETRHTPQQEVLCELSQDYLKGFQQGLTDPANQEEAGRRLLEKARERGSEFPRDAKLNETQRMFRDLSEVNIQGFLQAAQWQELDPKQKGDEQRWLKQLSSDKERPRMLAIYALAAMHSKKAVPGIRQIATDRKEKDDADRAFACHALGVIGDSSVVPRSGPPDLPLRPRYALLAADFAGAADRRELRPRRGRLAAVVAEAGGKPPISVKKVIPI